MLWDFLLYTIGVGSLDTVEEEFGPFRRAGRKGVCINIAFQNRSPVSAMYRFVIMLIS